ncbi:MAG: hypothetical protein PHI34_01055 [Acidobacteriota bacterium]|nr:hypothetical protein [Acidobacteriota bacterium]
MLRDEIRTDISFLKGHDLQPKWWKFGKILFLTGIIVALVLIWGWVSALVWFAVFVACANVVHFMYRAKTNKYTVDWADFRIDPKNRRRKFGTLYYPLVAASLALATIIMLLLSPGIW